MMEIKAAAEDGTRKHRSYDGFDALCFHRLTNPIQRKLLQWKEALNVEVQKRGSLPQFSPTNIRCL